VHIHFLMSLRIICVFSSCPLNFLCIPLRLLCCSLRYLSHRVTLNFLFVNSWQFSCASNFFLFVHFPISRNRLWANFFHVTLNFLCVPLRLLCGSLRYLSHHVTLNFLFVNSWQFSCASNFFLFVHFPISRNRLWANFFHVTLNFLCVPLRLLCGSLRYLSYASNSNFSLRHSAVPF